MKKAITWMSFILILLFAFPAFAADVPKEVLNAKNSVLRIEVSTPDSIFTGSGFVFFNELLLKTV